MTKTSSGCTPALQLPPRRSQPYYPTSPLLTCIPHNPQLSAELPEKQHPHKGLRLDKFFCFVTRTFDHIIAVLNCAVLHSHVHDLEPCCGRHASPMQSSGQAAQPHCRPVSPNRSNPHRPKSLAYTLQCRFRCPMPCHHSRKIRQSLVTTTLDDELFFLIYSCRPSANMPPHSNCHYYCMSPSCPALTHHIITPQYTATGMPRRSLY